MNIITSWWKESPITSPSAPRRLQILAALVAILFFIGLKWTLVTLIFAGNVHPELDDTYHYLSNIERNAVVGIGSLDADYMLTYQFWLGWTVPMAGLRNLLPFLSPEGTFQLNFYLGLALMGLTVAWLGWRARGWLFGVLAVVVLAVFYGKGEYHGFFWVVPSFYLLLLILLAFIQLISPEHDKRDTSQPWRQTLRTTFRFDRRMLWLVFLGAVTGLIHLSSLVGLVILFGYVFFLSLLERRIDWTVVGKVAIFTVAFMVALVGWQLLGALGIVPEMLPLSSGFTSSATGNVSADFLLSGLNNYIGQPLAAWPLIADLRDLYLGWFLASGALERIIHIVAMGGPFLLGLFVNLRYDRRKALSAFYFSTLALFVVMDIVTQRGERTLLYVFPATFLLAAYGYLVIFTTAFRLWQERPGARRLARAIALGGLALLLALVGRSSLRQIGTANATGQSTQTGLTWGEDACLDHVLSSTAPDELVAYNRDVALHFWLTRGMVVRPARFLGQAGDVLAEKQQTRLYLFCEDFTSLDPLCESDLLMDQLTFQAESVEHVRDCGDFSLFEILMAEG